MHMNVNYCHISKEIEYTLDKDGNNFEDKDTFGCKGPHKIMHLDMCIVLMIQEET